MVGCWFCGWCGKETISSAAGNKSQYYSRTDDGENGGHLCTATKKTPSVERAGNIEGETLTKQKELEFCLVFLRPALQLVNRRGSEEI